MPSKLPRKEAYRVTLARPQGVKVEQIRQWITEGLNLHDTIEAKVELIRSSSSDAVEIRGFWDVVKDLFS